MASANKTAEISGTTGMRPGDWAWLLQRVTAVIIAIIIAVHLWIQHFGVPITDPVTYQEVVERLRNPLFLLLDIVFLAAGLFHAVNGLRAIFLDFGLGRRGEAALNISAVIAGIALFGFGLIILVPFLLGRWPVW
ncbi:MAG: succinate dehydrogenase, cytochrome b556 subunit [Chloroflexota bacterium]